MEWEGTRGYIRYISHGKGRYDIVSHNNVLIAELDSEITPPYSQNTGKAQSENVNLICDSFNTIQKCDLLPSELLERYNEAIEALKLVRLDVVLSGAFKKDGQTVNGIDLIIQKHKK